MSRGLESNEGSENEVESTLDFHEKTGNVSGDLNLVKKFSDYVMREFLLPEKFIELSQLSEENIKKILDILPKVITLKAIKYQNKSRPEVARNIASNRLFIKLRTNIVNSLKQLGILKDKYPRFKTKELKKWSSNKLVDQNVDDLTKGIEVKLTDQENLVILKIFIKENTVKSK